MKFGAVDVRITSLRSFCSYVIDFIEVARGRLEGWSRKSRLEGTASRLQRGRSALTQVTSLKLLLFDEIFNNVIRGSKSSLEKSTYNQTQWIEAGKFGAIDDVTSRGIVETGDWKVTCSYAINLKGLQQCCS